MDESDRALPQSLVSAVLMSPGMPAFCREEVSEACHYLTDAVFSRNTLVA